MTHITMNNKCIVSEFGLFLLQLCLCCFLGHSGCFVDHCCRFENHLVQLGKHKDRANIWLFFLSVL